MDIGNEKKVELLHNDLLYVTIATDHLYSTKENERDILHFKARCKSHLETMYWDSESNVYEIIDQLERRGLVGIGKYAILKDIVCFNMKMVREIKKTELALQTLGVTVVRDPGDDKKDEALAIRVQMDENSTECQIDETFKGIIRTISGNICEKIDEAFDKEDLSIFNELNKRWKLHDMRTMESVSFIRYFHQGNCEKFQRLLTKCLNKSEEHMFKMDQGFYNNSMKWRQVNDALLRQNNVENLFKEHGAVIYDALKGSIFIFVRFQNIEDLDNFHEYYENKNLERDLQRLYFKGQKYSEGKLIVRINDENFTRHKSFIESLDPEHLVLNSTTILQNFEAEYMPHMYETSSMRHVLEVLQTNSCVIMNSEPGCNMTMLTSYVVSKLKRIVPEAIPLFSSSLQQVWKVIDNVTNFVVLCCKPSKYDLYDDEILSSFFSQFEKRVKGKDARFKIIATIDARFIQNVTRQIIRYDISPKVVNVSSDHILDTDIIGVADCLTKRYNMLMSEDHRKMILKRSKKGAYSSLKSVMKRKDAEIDKHFHVKSDEAIALIIIFLRNGEFSFESDCENVNKAVSHKLRREGYISTKTLSTSVTNLLDADILRWRDSESNLCFSNGFILQCVVENIIKLGFDTFIIESAHLKRIDILNSFGVLGKSSFCNCVIHRLEKELQLASSEYATEIFSMKIWGNSHVQDVLTDETNEAVSFYQSLQYLNLRLHHKLIEIFVLTGNCFLFKYFIKKMKVNEASLFSYFAAGIQSGSVKMCELLVNYFQNDVDFDPDQANLIAQLVVESRSLQIVKFFHELVGEYDESALFLAIQSGSTQIADYLINSGVGIFSRDDEQQTVLHMASKIDNPDLFSFILRKTPHLINKQDTMGLFPLYNAASSGFIHHVALLWQEENIDLSLHTVDKENFLHASVRSLSKSVLCFVIEKLSDSMFSEQLLFVNKLGYTPLDLAVSFTDRQLVECLISKASSLEIMSHFNTVERIQNTSLLMSTSATFSEFLSGMPCYGLFFSLLSGLTKRISEEFGLQSEIYAFDKWCFYSLYYASYPQYQSILEEVGELCKILLQSFHLNPDLLEVEDHLGMTPLSLAVCCNADNIVPLFVEKGAGHCRLSKNKSTLLHFSVKYGKTDLIKVLPKFPQWYIDTHDSKGFLAVDYLITRSEEDMDIFLEYFFALEFKFQDENGDTILNRLARCDIATEFGLPESRVIDQWISLSKSILNKFPSAIECMNKKGNSSLWDMVLNGKVDLLEYFLHLGVDIFKVYSGGRSLLHAAVLSNSVTILHLIIDRAIKIINKLDFDHNTPLMLAVSMDLDNIATVFIEKRCNLRETNTKGMDVFDIAFEMGNMEIAKKIVQADPAINRKKSVNRLSLAITSSKSEEIKDLFEFRYGIDSKNADGETILHIAVKQRNISAVISILNIPDEENPFEEKDKSVVEDLSLCDSISVQRPFVGCSSLINVTTFENKTPLFISLETGFDDGCYCLLSSNAYLGTRTRKRQTVIHAAVKGVGLRKLDFNILIEILNKSRDLINVADVNDVPPLFMKESLAETRISRLLLKYGANFRKKSKQKENIVHLLIQYEHFTLIDDILEMDNKLAYQEDNKGNTPLHVCATKCETNESHLLTCLCRENPKYMRKHGIEVCMLALHYRRFNILTDIFSSVLKACRTEDITVLIRNILSLKPCKEFAKCIQIAVENGNLKIIKELLIPEMEDCVDNDGNTLLYYAVRSKSPRVLMYLHQRAPRLMAVRNYKGFSVLMISMLEGNFSCLSYLLEVSRINEYEDIVLKAVTLTNDEVFSGILRHLNDFLNDEQFQHIRDFKQNLPCFEATKRGYVEKFKSILAFGGGALGRKNHPMNFVHAAVISKDLDMVKKVIQHLNRSDKSYKFKRQELNKKAKNGKTPLFKAIEFGLTDIVNFLLKLDPDLHAKSDDGSTVLHAAIRYCHANLIYLLCKLDSTLINIEDHQGKTALDHALLNGNLKIINAIERLSKSYHFTSTYVFKKFEKAIQQKEVKEIEMIALVKFRVSFHLIQNNARQSVLHLCVLYENQTVMKMILNESTKKSYLLEKEDEEGMTVLYHCVSKGNYDWVEMFLNSGANPNKPKSGTEREDKIKLWFTEYHTSLKFPLQVAVNNGDFNISKLLVDFKADTRMKGPNGENLLFLASARGESEICSLLLEADPRLANGFYKKFLTPHIFEFLLFCSINQVIMQRSSIGTQFLLLLKLICSKIMQCLTNDFSIMDIFSVLLPILIALILCEANLNVFLAGIISFLFLRRPCKDMVFRCFFYIFLILLFRFNFMYLYYKGYKNNEYPIKMLF